MPSWENILLVSISYSTIPKICRVKKLIVKNMDLNFLHIPKDIWYSSHSLDVFKISTIPNWQAFIDACCHLSMFIDACCHLRDVQITILLTFINKKNEKISRCKWWHNLRNIKNMNFLSCYSSTMVTLCSQLIKEKTSLRL
jgi:hypothetical protein